MQGPTALLYRTAWDRSQLVVPRHHRRRSDIFCLTVTHWDVEFVILFHRLKKIYIIELLSKNVPNSDNFKDHNDDNWQKFFGEIFL